MSFTLLFIVRQSDTGLNDKGVDKSSVYKTRGYVYACSGLVFRKDPFFKDQAYDDVKRCSIKHVPSLTLTNTSKTYLWKSHNIESIKWRPYDHEPKNGTVTSLTIKTQTQNSTIEHNVT